MTEVETVLAAFGTIVLLASSLVLIWVFVKIVMIVAAVNSSTYKQFTNKLMSFVAAGCVTAAAVWFAAGSISFIIFTGVVFAVMLLIDRQLVYETAQHTKDNFDDD